MTMGSDRSASRSAATPLAVLVVGASVLLMGLLLFRLIDRYAVNLLFFDQWDTYRPLFEQRSIWGVFNQQHGPPRLGLGLVFTKVVADATSWNTRAEAFATGGLIVAAMLVAFYLKIRLFGRLTATDAVLPMMFLTLLQFESLVIAPMPAHGAMPLLLLMLIAHAWTCRQPEARYPAIVLLNFLLVYTGFGLFMGAITPLLLAMDLYQRARHGEARRWRWPLGTLLLSMASWYAFSIDYRPAAATDGVNVPLQRPWDYPWFVALMLARFLGVSSHLSVVVATVLGFAVLLLMVVVLAHHLRMLASVVAGERQISRTIAMLVGYTLLFAAATAVGRMVIGIGASQTSRYMTLLIPGFFGLYLHFLTVRSVLPRVLPLAVMATLLLPWPLAGRDLEDVSNLAAAKHAWKKCYLEREDLPTCQRHSFLMIHPTPEALNERLAYLKAHRLNLYAE